MGQVADCQGHTRYEGVVTGYARNAGHWRLIVRWHTPAVGLEACGPSDVAPYLSRSDLQIH